MTAAPVQQDQAPYCLPEIGREAEAALAWLDEALAHLHPLAKMAVADRLAEIRAEILSER